MHSNLKKNLINITNAYINKTKNVYEICLHFIIQTSAKQHKHHDQCHSLNLCQSVWLQEL